MIKYPDFRVVYQLFSPFCQLCKDTSIECHLPLLLLFSDLSILTIKMSGDLVLHNYTIDNGKQDPGFEDITFPAFEQVLERITMSAYLPTLSEPFTCSSFCCIGVV